MDERGRRRGDLTPQTIGDTTFRRTYLFANGVWLALGVAAAISAVTYFVNPVALHDSSVGAKSGVLAVMWNVMYLIGGMLLVAGLVGCVRHWGWRAELAGLSLIAASVLINAVAIVAHRGAPGASTVTIDLALAVAAAARAWAVVKLMGVHR